MVVLLALGEAIGILLLMCATSCVLAAVGTLICKLFGDK